MRRNKHNKERALGGPGSPLRVALVLLGVAAAAWPVCCYPQSSRVPASGATGPSTPRGYALAIGLNRVDPNHYTDNWDGQLRACETDAKDMQAIAADQGFQTDILLTEQATRGRVIEKLECLAETLQSGDLLVLSYAGHGGQVRDANGDEKDDHMDETWCLYDGHLLDDELYGAWMKFPAGVRILVFSDSCCSGTVVRLKVTDLTNPSRSSLRDFDEKWKEKSVPLDGTAGAFAVRSMPPSVLVNTYQQHRAFYDEMGKAAPKEDPEQKKVSVILISGCEDYQKVREIGDNGLFTSMVKKVWNNGGFIGNHRNFHKQIRERVMRVNRSQSPKFFVPGAGESTEEFIQQKPYTVE